MNMRPEDMEEEQITDDDGKQPAEQRGPHNIANPHGMAANSREPNANDPIIINKIK